MLLPALLCILGALLVFAGVLQAAFLSASWLGINFLLLGAAQVLNAPGLFGKRPDGTLPPWSWIAFLPLHLYTLLIWHLARLGDREPAYHVVNEHLVIGRRLLPGELPGRFDNYIDLTAEFQEPAAIRKLPGYRCLPVLDTRFPPPGKLRALIDSLPPGRTYVHCAQGHGRTGCAAAALLLKQGTAHTADEAVKLLQTARPSLRLSRGQWARLRAFAGEAAN
jgi:hypothetical protein